jgi:hypothetical protein
LDNEANSCDECVDDPDDGTCDHCESLAIEVTGFTSASCGSCNCTELNNVYILAYDASCVWLGYNDGIAVQITKGATWVLTLHCASTANPACATFTQPIDGNCPLPEPWTLIASTCSGGGVGGVVYRPPNPDPDGTPCTLGTCCSHYNITVTGFTSSSLCGPNCNCGDYNTTYDFFKSGNEWVSANQANKISGIMQCIDSTWYVTLSCGISINPLRPTMGAHCVQFTAPDVDGCPPEDNSWTLDATFPGCNDSDGGGASITVEEDAVLCNPCTPDPSMLITITAPDGSLPITWCGITWRPSTFSPLGPNDRYSGQSAEVCPTAYRKARSVYTGFYGPTTVIYSGQHRWFFTGSELHLQRQYNVSYLTFGFWFAPFGGGNLNLLSLKVGEDDFKTFTGNQATRFSVAGFPNSNTVVADLNKILGVVSPTYNGYELTNDFFGSHVVSGITYTWAKGAGW